MSRPKLNKEITYIQVQVTPEEKAAFDLWCRANSTTMSQVVRKEIEPYVKKGKALNKEGSK